MEADINCKIEAYLGSQNEEMTSFIKQGNYFTKDNIFALTADT